MNVKKKPWSAITASVFLGLLFGWLTQKMGAVGLCKPFGALGEWLRELSLGSVGGNIAAWGIVLVLSALPFLALLKKGRHFKKTDYLLFLCSAEILAMLYFLVNPTRISSRLLWMDKSSLVSIWTLACIGVLGATVLAWLVLTYLDGMERKAGRLLPGFLILCSILLAFASAFGGMGELAGELAATGAGNTEGQILRTTGLLKGLILLVRLIPTVLSCRLLFWGSELTSAVESDPFGEETLSRVEGVAARCKAVAKVSVLCTVGTNLLQLLCLPYMADIRVRVDLPLVALALCGGMFLLCSYFRRAKEIHDDNVTII